jgi:hypothetical protein
MISKKDIPLNLLKAIEPIAQANLDLIQLRSEDNTYYSFIENDTNSKNLFKILIDGSKRINNYNGGNYVVEMKPIDETGTRHHIFQDNIESVIRHFEKWIKLIRDIHDTPSIHDDNFTKSYTDFYFNEFKVIDTDAEVSPFNPEQQELIELYIESVSDSINIATEPIDNELKSKLISELKEIGDTLSKSTKNQVMRNLSKIYAKLHKISKSFAKGILSEAKKKLFSKLIQLGIEYGPKLIETISKNI